MDQHIIDLYGEFTGKRLDRRGFLKKLSKLAGGAAAAAALLPLLEKGNAHAQMVPKDDARLHTEYIKYAAETGDMRAYLARPKGTDKRPAVIVIHENRGLRPQTEDVARRFAVEGFLAIAPDALSPLGGAPADANQGRTLMRKLDKDATTKNFIAAVKYLKTHPQTTGKVGVTGFCWGGAMTNRLAVNCPDLEAAVPFYGRQPAAEDVPKIKAALLCHYGELDKRINQGIEAFETALKAASIEYKIYIYEGAKHAFFNDTNPERYHKEAALLAWKRTLAFFKEKLKT
jgi:carboxymethylenebutenolidase